MAERDRLADGFLDEVAQSIAYAEAVDANREGRPGREESRLRQLASDIELELAAEEIDTQGTHDGG